MCDVKVTSLCILAESILFILTQIEHIINLIEQAFCKYC